METNDIMSKFDELYGIMATSTNADSKLFTSEVAKCTGKAVFVAKKGLIVELLK